MVRFVFRPFLLFVKSPYPSFPKGELNENKKARLLLFHYFRNRAFLFEKIRPRRRAN